MSGKFKIAETEAFQNSINKPKFRHTYKKIDHFVYPQLRNNPFFGPNIKKLKGELSGLYRYRLGDYRLFYKIDDKRIIVFILNISVRKDAY